jgi:hypothetical protein
MDATTFTSGMKQSNQNNGTGSPLPAAINPMTTTYGSPQISMMIAIKIRSPRTNLSDAASKFMARRSNEKEISHGKVSCKHAKLIP